MLNLLGALDTPTGGTVIVNGVDISRLGEDELARLRSDQVGFIFQFHYLLDEFTCLENALMPITIRDGDATAEDQGRVIDLLRRVGLGNRIHHRLEEMSGGENQRCDIVRALANARKIVLADELTENLDSRSGEEVFQLVFTRAGTGTASECYHLRDLRDLQQLLTRGIVVVCILILMRTVLKATEGSSHRCLK